MEATSLNPVNHDLEAVKVVFLHRDGLRTRADDAFSARHICQNTQESTSWYLAWLGVRLIAESSGAST